MKIDNLIPLTKTKKSLKISLLLISTMKFWASLWKKKTTDLQIHSQGQRPLMLAIDFLFRIKILRKSNTTLWRTLMWGPRIVKCVTMNQIRGNSKIIHINAHQAESPQWTAPIRQLTTQKSLRTQLSKECTEAAATWNPPVTLQTNPLLLQVLNMDLKKHLLICHNSPIHTIQQLLKWSIE